MHKPFYAPSVGSFLILIRYDATMLRQWTTVLRMAMEDRTAMLCIKKIVSVMFVTAMIV